MRTTLIGAAAIGLGIGTVVHVGLDVWQRSRSIDARQSPGWICDQVAKSTIPETTVAWYVKCIRYAAKEQARR